MPRQRTGNQASDTAALYVRLSKEDKEGKAAGVDSIAVQTADGTEAIRAQRDLEPPSGLEPEPSARGSEAAGGHGTGEPGAGSDRGPGQVRRGPGREEGREEGRAPGGARC